MEEGPAACPGEGGVPCIAPDAGPASLGVEGVEGVIAAVRAAAAGWVMGGLRLVLESRVRDSALREMAATVSRSW